MLIDCVVITDEHGKVVKIDSENIEFPPHSEHNPTINPLAIVKITVDGNEYLVAHAKWVKIMKMREVIQRLTPSPL